MTMVPALLIFSGSLPARASSTAGALDDAAGALEVLLPSESESEPQAVMARAVVAAAATASARVRIMEKGPFAGCPGTGSCPGRACGDDPATEGGKRRHTDITTGPTTVPRGATCVTP